MVWDRKKKDGKLCIICGDTDKSNFYFHNKSRCKIHLREYQKELKIRKPEYAEKRRLDNKNWYHKTKDARRELVAARAKRYWHSDLERNREKARLEASRKKDAVMEMYGGKCNCCGETIRKFLTLDHVNNDGAEQRKTIKNEKVYRKLFREKIIDNRYQVLCFNCNSGRHINKGVCPHKDIK